MRQEAAQAGDEIPTPEVAAELMWAWRAWNRLHADRPWLAGGMGPMMPGGIPWAAVREWCEFHDYPGEAVPYLDRVCRAMDQVYFAWYRTKLPKQGKK